MDRYERTRQEGDGFSPSLSLLFHRSSLDVSSFMKVLKHPTTTACEEEEPEGAAAAPGPVAEKRRGRIEFNLSN